MTSARIVSLPALVRDVMTYNIYLSLMPLGSACTFQGIPCRLCAENPGVLQLCSGPSFKRGPPKGYIHAIEQRWHQVECILATIIASQRARDVVTELRNDPMARAILDRVDAGPYVSRAHS